MTNKTQEFTHTLQELERHLSGAHRFTVMRTGDIKKSPLVDDKKGPFIRWDDPAVRRIFERSKSEREKHNALVKEFWQILGIQTFDQLRGRSIRQILEELQEEVVKYRELLRKVM